MMTLNPSTKFYRLATIWNSFKALYHLPPQKVDAFLEAYNIYHCDWVHGQAMDDSKPIEYEEIKQKLIHWYEVINHLCALGQVEKMYIPPTLDLAQNVIENQILFERKFAHLLEIKAKDKVFELGCGKGRVAAHLAALTGAQITGINIDQTQLDNAIAFAKKKNLSQQCQFINADFNDLPFAFADNYFDCIYEIQALSLSRDLGKLFSELYRILKPGGKLSLLEWVRLPNYNAQDPHHLELMQKIKPLIGAIGTPSPEDYQSLLLQAGFEVLVSEDPSINKSQEPLIHKAGSNYDKITPIVKFLVKINLLPQHFSLLLDRLSQDVEALCEADRLGLVTMSYHLVAQKIE
ncbi:MULTISPECIES: class I SAM-dependent methyltransferase [Legionella]|uniref:Biotin synthase BioC n=1 Tax=Legionella maceachernii TaxID=466 RepID=A0A0W0WGF7_9GAMM|nr:methyltransferase domain-containing protein [Legionella maceachernii]KTD31420.1 biotin synthase BioC [Legionella maceachernii]SKA23127.1 sterol 24-C-methyltransferase [Legionella maceachernii]SUO98689.1 Rebeccamycin O-methyltransferase [Legionella maceachernii]